MAFETRVRFVGDDGQEEVSVTVPGISELGVGPTVLRGTPRSVSKRAAALLADERIMAIAPPQVVAALKVARSLARTKIAKRVWKGVKKWI